MMIVQIGVGSGGIIVLDLLMRDPRITQLVLIDPDRYEAHNVHRHLFPADGVGRLKVDLAAEWVKRFRPEMTIQTLPVDVMAADAQATINDLIAECAFGIGAVDTEVAKFHVDALMRRHQRPWTLGEVLSGGIGGWVHAFTPGGACYGCVASHLRRSVTLDHDRPPANYADANATVTETRIPASRSAISVIASLQATCTQELLSGKDIGFTSLLLPLTKVDGIFTESLRPYRFQIPRSPECFVCGANQETLSGGELDAALDQALARLAHE